MKLPVHLMHLAAKKQCVEQSFNACSNFQASFWDSTLKEKAWQSVGSSAPRPWQHPGWWRKIANATSPKKHQWQEFWKALWFCVHTPQVCILLSLACHETHHPKQASHSEFNSCDNTSNFESAKVQLSLGRVCADPNGCWHALQVREWPARTLFRYAATLLCLCLEFTQGNWHRLASSSCKDCQECWQCNFWVWTCQLCSHLVGGEVVNVKLAHVIKRPLHEEHDDPLGAGYPQRTDWAQRRTLQSKAIALRVSKYLSLSLIRLSGPCHLPSQTVFDCLPFSSESRL